MADKPDNAAQAALAASVRRPVDFAFLDIAGAPMRVTNAPYDITFTGTGDEDLDGFTFEALDPRFVSVGDVKLSEKGADTVTLKLSGLASIDDETMNEIGDRQRWQGRDARLWKGMLDPKTLSQLGAVWCYHTGVMAVPRVLGSAESQVIELDVEGYLAWFTQASNRTYLTQSDFDPGDQSAALAIAIANGAGKKA
ncbi:hypothetical protein S2M10_31630 [Sphingomonas sp. S2M10]|uniref:hypothetical protein n=1 Tax=Sphingomonas sp. S2M10 TaxID=2705010 RepID=UPI00145775AB|nr:hypothetical protein [Sphingomonas sp. S2M10]NLS28154.1 hypothetical protein [Sphingomonas sp. S2M10]